MLGRFLPRRHIAAAAPRERRERFGSMLAALLVLVVPLAALAQGESRPNLVVILLDDLDEATLSRARELGLMPNFEADFGRGGLVFEQSFVTDSLCCPSRATFLTGQYPHNHGVLNITAPEGSFAAFDDREAVNVWLQRAGYRTGLIGKYLNGYGYVSPRNCPTCESTHYVPTGWDDWQGTLDRGELDQTPGIGYAGTYCMYNYTINDNGSWVTHRGANSDYQTDVFAQRAATFVDEAAQIAKPFFLVVAPLAPHYELCLPAADNFSWDVRAPARYADSLPTTVRLDPLKPSLGELDVGDKPAWFESRYPPLTDANVDSMSRFLRHRIEALRAVDDLLGLLRQRLIATGAWDDTVLIFTSDNGWLYGEHRTWGKVFAYEESIRVPLWMRGPGIPPGQMRSATALNNDLAATLLAFGRATPGLPLDGRSLLLPIAADHPVDWRRRFLIEHYRDFAGAPVDYADFFALRTAANEISGGAGRTWIDWRQAGISYGVEHYDLAADPYQIASRPSGANEAAEEAALRASLAALRDCGRPGYASCATTEREVEHLFFSGFEDGASAQWTHSPQSERRRQFRRDRFDHRAGHRDVADDQMPALR